MSAKAPSAREITLPSHLDLAGAGALREQLVGALDAGDPVVLDGNAVTNVDVSGLQVLSAFVRDASQARQPVSWTAHSPALLDSARRLGLTAALCLVDPPKG
jgi:anti-anti-sigma regulatory factor